MGRAYTDSYHLYNSDGAAKVGHFFSLAASIAILGALNTIHLAAVQAQPAPYTRSEQYGLQANDSGESVLDLQHRLAEMGYYAGEIDGIFSVETQEAVYRFQQEMGLAADGIVGPATTQALYGSAPTASTGQNYGTASGSATPLSTVHLNDSGDQIIELQQRLSDLGYYDGELSGVFDYSTEAAVMQFQRDNNLVTDGVVGESTAAAMRQPTELVTRPTVSSRQNSTASQPGSTASTPADGILALGDTGQEVSDLQLRLKELGFYQGEVTGAFGPETESAVIAFQQSSGLTTDGIAGPQVSSALYSFSGSTGSTGSAGVGNAGITTGTSIDGTTNLSSGGVAPGTASSGSLPDGSTATTTNGPASGNSSANNSTNSSLPNQEIEQARLQAEQARLQAEQAQVVLFQNLEEGEYSVAALQRELRNRGFYPGEINGMLTAETQSAIAEAQRQYELSQTDVFSGNTTTIDIENETEAVQVPGTVQPASPDALFPY